MVKAGLCDGRTERSSAADERHKLDAIAVEDQVLAMVLTGHDVLVDFDSQVVLGHIDVLDQLVDGHRAIDLCGGSIDRDGNHEASSKAASKATLEGAKSSFLVNAQASRAPKVRSIPESSHS